MVNTLYRCQNQRRRLEVQKRQDENGLPILNGIDYLEVSADRQTLFVYFIHPLQQNPQESVLTLENIQIEGGRTPVQIESLTRWGDRLTLRLFTPGGAAPHTLRLVQFPANPQSPQQPPSGFDSQLVQVSFSFVAGALSEFDCAPAPAVDAAAVPAPVIDYLAKDYASFRQLMLDRLAVTMPQWKERSPADLGNVLVELVAYVADHLSYYQDAVATEAYLGTARRRASVRRHARLLNYPMHEGCNARVWLVVQVNRAITLSAGTLEQPGLQFLTQVSGLPPVLSSKQVMTALDAGAQVFEPLHSVILHPALNEIKFYTWGDTYCVLSKGATTATLDDRQGELAFLLTSGRAILIQAVKGVDSGEAADADPSQRHWVRLTRVTPGFDQLFLHRVVEVEWLPEDALPFDVVVSQVVNDRPICNISIVRGNGVLVDHGRTIREVEKQDLGMVNSRFRPRLLASPLTYQGQVRTAQGKIVPFDAQASATSALQWSLPTVKPAILVCELEADGTTRSHWTPQKDLLNSSRFAREFVVETEEDGRAYLRFGDGELGRQPPMGTVMKAFYRVGNGTAGNVGAESIAHVFSPDPTLHDSLLQSDRADRSFQPIYNPLAATGGIDPEPLEQVRLDAPQAFKTLQRAVTEADYAEIAQRFPGVAQAIATRRWTGSWYTFFIRVDRAGGLPVDATFKAELQAFLARFRLTGHDIEIEAPRFVPLDIALRVQVLPDYFQSQVKEALLKTFSNQVQETGQLGFFHPDRLTFGQSLYLSQVIFAAMQVTGVQSVSVMRFQRLGLAPQEELATGQIRFARLEIARLDNDPSTPAGGKLELIMEGGL